MFSINQDTAETYPIPSAVTTHGASEKIIGQWLKQKGNRREDVVISTSICGFSDQINWCRENNVGTRINRKQVEILTTTTTTINDNNNNYYN